MKKLLILMLVLGMASVVNATTMSWSEDAITISAINGTVVVQLIVDDAEPYVTKYVGYDPATVSLGSITMIHEIANNAGDDETIQNPSQVAYPGWWSVRAADLSPPSDIQSGSQYSVTIQGYAAGTFGLDSDDYGQNDVLEVTVIPEPMTVALLGLGSLFMLRRRKK